MDNSKVNRALADTEKRAEATNRAGESVGDGFERGAKKGTGALGKISRSLLKVRKDAQKGAEFELRTDESALDRGYRKMRAYRADASKGATFTTTADFDDASARAGMASFERARESADGKEVNVSADFDGAGAIAGMLAFRAAAAGVTAGMSSMGSGVSAGGVRIAMIGGVAATAAAMFTPLLGALASVGSLGAAAGAGIGLIAAPLMMVISRLTSYHESLDKVATAQSSADSASQAYADSQRAVADAQRGVAEATAAGARQIRDAEQALASARREGTQAIADAERNLQDARRSAADSIANAEDNLASARDELRTATQSLVAAQEDLNDALREEPLNQREATLDLADARDRASDAQRDYNAAVREYGKNSEEASDAARELERAELDLQRTEQEVQDTRKNGSDELQAARDGVKQAYGEQQDAADGVQTAEEELAAARLEGARSVSDAQRDLAEAQRSASEQIRSAEQGLADARTDAARQVSDAQRAVADAQRAAAQAAADQESALAKVAEEAVTLSPALMALYNAAMLFGGTAMREFSGAQNAIARLGVAILRDVTPALSVLARASEATIGALSRSWAGFMAQVRQPIQQQSFSTLLGITPQVIQSLASGVGSLGLAITNMLAAAAPYAVRLAQGFERSMNALLGWSRSGAAVKTVVAAVKSAGPVFSALWTVVKQVSGALFEFGVTNSRHVATAIRWVGQAVTWLINGFSRLTQIFGPIVPIAAALTPIFLGMALVFGQVLSLFTPLVAVFGAVAGVLGAPLTIAIVAAVAAAALLIANWSRVRAAFAQVRAALAPLIASFRAGFAQIKAQVMPILTAVGRGIRTGLTTAIRFLIPQVRQLAANFRAGFAQVRSAVMPVISAVGRGLRAGLGAAFKFALNQARVVVRFFQTNWPLIRRTAATVFGAVKRDVGNAIQNAAKVVRAVWGALTKWWQANNKHLGAIVRAAWNTIKTIVSTTIKVVLGIIRATMQAINGNWKGAWNTIKGVLQTVWNAIKQLVKNSLTIIKNLLQVAWNTIKQVAQAAWNGIKNVLSNAWTTIQNNIRTSREQIAAGLKTTWENIKNAASSAWDAIKEAIGSRVSGILETVNNFISDIKSAINSVLDLVGLPPLGEGSGAKPAEKSGPKGTGGSGSPARSVRARRFAKGGYVDGDETYVVGDRGQREYVINPSRRDNAGLIRSAAADYQRHHRTGRSSRPRVPASTRRGLFPPWHAGGASSVGPETHSYVPEMRKFVDEAESRFDIYTNSYTNHPPDFEQPYWRERSVDFWGPGGRGAPIGTSLGDETTAWTVDRLAGDLNWLIWNGRMLTSQGWGPDTSGFDHSGHQHTSAFGNTPTATGGGSGGNLLSALFERAWSNTVEPIVNRMLGPLKDSPFLLANIAGAGAQKIPDGIKSWIMDKLGSMGGLSGGSGLSGTPAQNRKLGEEMFPNSGLPGQFSDVDAIWTQESGWDHTAQNPTSSAFGIPQFLDSTWQQYGGVSKDAEGQIKKGFMYIGDRYGSTGDALAFKQANGWYSEGGLIRKEHDARVHPGELYLPLDNPGVMQTAQTALGTAELRAEIASLKQALVGKLDDVNLGEPSRRSIEIGTQNRIRQYAKGGEMQRDIKAHVGTLGRLDRISGGPR